MKPSGNPAQIRNQSWQKILQLTESNPQLSSLLNEYRDLVESQLSHFENLFEKINQPGEIEKFKAMESMATGLVIQDNLGAIINFNPSALKILGLTEDQIRGRTSTDPRWRAIRPDRTPFEGSEHPAMIALRTGTPVLGVMMGLLLPNEEERWIKINAIPYEHNSGRKVATNFTDVTEQFQSETEIRNIFNHSPDFICVLSSDGIFKKVTPSFTQILGKSEEELIGVKFSDVVGGEFSSDSSATNFEGKIQTSSGDLILVSWIRKHSQESGDFYIFGRDLTNLKKTESMLSEAQNIAKIGSWQYNFETGEQWWSKEHYHIFEISENQSPKGLYELYRSRIHPEDIATLDGLMINAKTKGEDFIYDHRVYLDNGQRIKHVRGIGKVTKDINGKPSSISGTCQDQTDIVQLQEQNKFILDAMGIGIWKFNPVSQELYWDHSMYRLFEVEPSEFSGHYEAWESTLSPAAKDQAILELKQSLAGEKEYNTTFEIITKSGNKKHIGGRGVVVRNVDQQPIMMYGMNWDKTQEVNLNLSLHAERLKSIHNSKLASLGEMSAGIAHEINNPLAIIASSIPLLIKFRDEPEKYDRKIESIKGACHRIAKIVNGLRKFSRSSEKVERKITGLKEIILESIVITESKAKRCFCPISVQINAEPSTIGDVVELEQVIVNLINNAIDANSNESQKWVRVELSETPDEAIIKVMDSGHGISESVELKLFQPFFTTKPVGEGTGLGLSIAKGIVESHNGSINLIRSCKNTCFEIRLPKLKSEVKIAC